MRVLTSHTLSIRLTLLATILPFWPVACALPALLGVSLPRVRVLGRGGDDAGVPVHHVRVLHVDLLR